MPVEIPVDLMATGGRLIPPDVQAPKTEPSAPRARAEEPKRVEEPKKDEQPTVCPCCGWMVALDPYEPDEGEAQAFRDAVWRGDPFRRTVELHDGAATVVFRDLAPAEEEVCRTRLIAEMNRQPMDSQRAIQRLNELRLAFALDSMRLGDKTFANPPGTDPGNDLTKKTAFLQSACRSETVLRAVLWHYSRFQGALSTLVTRSASRSFPSATGPRGDSPASPPVG